VFPERPVEERTLGLRGKGEEGGTKAGRESSNEKKSLAQEAAAPSLLPPASPGGSEREGGRREREEENERREGGSWTGGREREEGTEGEFEPKKSLRQQIHSRLRVLGTLNCTIWSPK
jgi:hypothetical protein